MSVSRSVTRIGRRRPFATTAKKDAAVPSELPKAGIVGPPGIVEVAVTIHERPNSVRSMLNKRCYFATRVKKIFRTRPAKRSQPVTCPGASRRETMATPTGLWNSRSEEHTSELQSRLHLVCRLLLEKKKNITTHIYHIQVRDRMS